jgi:predicted Zn-dependent peptidase
MFDHGRIVTPDEEKRAVEAVAKADLIAAAEMIFKTTPAVALVGPVPDTDYLGLIRAELGTAH